MAWWRSTLQTIEISWTISNSPISPIFHTNSPWSPHWIPRRKGARHGGPKASKEEGQALAVQTLADDVQRRALLATAPDGSLGMALDHSKFFDVFVMFFAGCWACWVFWSDSLVGFRWVCWICCAFLLVWWFEGFQALELHTFIDFTWFD